MFEKIKEMLRSKKEKSVAKVTEVVEEPKEPKVNFFLYKDDKRMCGLYGAFCQFTDEPKNYGDTYSQRETVIGNLINRIKFMDGSPMPEFLKELQISVNKSNESHLENIYPNQVRIYTVNGKWVDTFSLDWEKATCGFYKCNP